MSKWSEPLWHVNVPHIPVARDYTCDRNIMYLDHGRRSVGDGGGTRPPTFQLGGDHRKCPPPLFGLKSGKSHVFYLLLTYIRMSACVIDTGLYK